MKLTHAEFSARGGRARAAKLTPKRRSAIARKAVTARWTRVKANKSA